MSDEILVLRVNAQEFVSILRSLMSLLEQATTEMVNLAVSFEDGTAEKSDVDALQSRTRGAENAIEELILLLSDLMNHPSEGGVLRIHKVSLAADDC